MVERLLVHPDKGFTKAYTIIFLHKVMYSVIVCIFTILFYVLSYMVLKQVEVTSIADCWNDNLLLGSLAASQFLSCNMKLYHAHLVQNETENIMVGCLINLFGKNNVCDTVIESVTY